MVEILLALLCAFIFRLIYERAEGIGVWIVRTGCRLLPKHIRHDTLERVEADLQHIEGPAWKLISAIGFWRVVVPKYLARTARLAKNPSKTGRELLAMGGSGAVTRALVTASTSYGLIQRKTKKGNRYAFLPVEDEDGVFEVVLFSDVLWEHAEHIKPNCRVRMIVESPGSITSSNLLRVVSVEEVEDNK